MKKTLKQLVTIRTGYQFRGRVEETPTGNVRVIQMKDFDHDHQLQTDGLTKVQVDAPERYAVTQGDVIFLSRGRQLTATEIIEPLQDVIATSYYFILTPKPDSVLPGFLAWSFNQPEFQHRVALVTNTTSIPWVSRAEFEQLAVDVPPLEVQQQVLDLTALQTKQQTLALKLIERRRQLVTAVCNRLVSGQANKEVRN